MDRGGAGGGFRHLSRPCPWHRAPGRRGRHRLFDGLCHRDRHAARVRHRLWSAVPLAGWPSCRANGGGGHCRHRLRLSGACHMNTLLRALLPTGLLMLTTSAWAHSPIMGIGGVFGGMLHALLIPEHGLSLLALGIALGLERPAASRSGMLIFVAALVAGLAVTAFIAEPALAADVLLAATGVLGLLIAAAWVPPVVAWPLAATAGVAFALDSRPEVTATDDIIRMLIGTGIGAAIALAIVAVGSAFLQGNVSRIVLRVLGSWVAAIAILDLSLRIATRLATGGS